jgi:hypothetical protein
MGLRGSPANRAATTAHLPAPTQIPITLTIKIGKDHPDLSSGHLVPADIEREIAIPTGRIASEIDLTWPTPDGSS